MPKLKTNKAVAKRIKVTGNKKLLTVKQNQNHFNGKDSGNTTRSKKKSVQLNVTRQQIKKVLPYS